MTSPQPKPPLAATGLRCFMVEDSALIRASLIATLEEILAVQVLGIAEDEAGALTWLQRNRGPCDLIIIDVFLKAGNGLEVLRHATRLRPESKRVVLTNFATPDMRRRCLQLGADRVFDKSSELEELIGYCGELSPPRLN